MTKGINVGIFGATGAVGKEMIKVLDRRKFPIDTIQLFASERSAGKRTIIIHGKVVSTESNREKNYIGTMQDIHNGGICIQNADGADPSSLDLALLAISGSWSRANAERLAEQCTVIDNSSAFRYEDGIPLIIPEINPQAVGDANLIANPNCTTAIAALPLWQLHQHFGGLERVSIATYQAASGAGNDGTSLTNDATIPGAWGGPA